MSEKADWVKLEFSSYQHHLGSVVCTGLPLLNTNLKSSVIVSNSIRIWAQFRRHFGLQGASVLSPIKSNHMFTPSCTDPAFTVWFNNGIKSIYNLYIEDTFASFSQLSELYSLPKNHLFRYLQIRSFVCKTFSSFPNKPIKSHIDHILELKSDRRGLISLISDLIGNVNPHPIEHLRAAWESDLGRTLTDDQWESVLDRVHTSSSSAKHSLIQLKVVHRAHLTNARLAKMYPEVEPSCPRCRSQPADLIHMFWVCPSLFTFWRCILKSFSEMFKTRIEPDPLCALFGLAPKVTCASLPNSAQVVIAFSTLLARRLILLKWKQHSPPSFSQWVKDVMYFLQLEKIKFLLRGSSNTFIRTWKPFLDFYDSLQDPLDKE